VSAFNKLPGFQRSPAGLEWALLRRLPPIALLGTVLPLLAAAGASLWLGADPEAAKLVTTVRIVLVSVLVLHWTAVFTVGLGCAIVSIAKGPAYVADAYDLIDADRPARAPAPSPTNPRRSP
jgi:hypothetical protein